MQLSILLALGAVPALVVYVVISAVIRQWRFARRARKLHCLPPPTLPSPDPFGIGLILQILESDRKKRMPDYIRDMQNVVSKQEGRAVSTFQLRRPIRKYDYFTTDPKNIQAILALQFKEFGVGDARTGNFEPLLGRGIFASDGDSWEHARSMLRPQFVREQISDLDLEERHVQNMMRVLDLHIGKARGWTDTVDLQPIFFNLTLDSATEFLFGESVNSQLDNLPGIERSKHNDIDFAYAFNRSQMHLAKAARMGDFWWLGHTKDFKDMCKQVHIYIDHFVQLALAQDQSEKEKDDKYVFLQALAKETRDPYELRSQLLNILLAGRDTTASLLGWLFMFLGQREHANTLAKLRAVIIESFGTYEQPKDISFRSLKACNYLQWCLNEALRLYPVVPMNSRRAFVDTTIPRGGGPDGTAPICVEKGQEVMYSVYVMHRRKELWGEDADIFRPDRWNGRKPGWEYLPFNGGPRICIGQQFALTEAGYVTVRLLQRFSGLEGTPVVANNHGLTLTSCPAEGVKIKMKLAGN